ncbi:MAG: T9SS type A sorting domain-containing protein [Flavobacteriales bacterium]|nr:T9SS type A sorting domain-containing protein [Flavobacteriales bacterium]
MCLITGLAQILLCHQALYWTVDGIWPAGFSADANISYNGKTNSTGYLDHLLIGATEDSLILVYRPSAHADWIEWPNYTKNIGSLSDKVGTIVIHQIQKGEYALAYKSSAVSLPVQADRFLHAYPNPSKGEWTIEWDTQVVSPFDYWQITDISGKQLLSNHEMVESPFLLSAQNLPEGHYFLSFGAKGKILAVIKIVRQ